MQAWKPNVLVLCGDIADFMEVSDFDRSPLRLTRFEDEIEEVRHWLRRWRDDVGPEATIYLLEGNHEERWRRFLTRKAPELARLRGMTLHEQFGLAELNIHLIAYEGFLDYLGFHIEHGSIVSNSAPAAGMTARRMIVRSGGSGLMGHTHRGASVSYTNDKGTHTWIENFCTCLLSQSYNKRRPDWQQGFTIGEVHNNKLHVQLIHSYPDGFWADGKFWPL